VVVVVEEPDPNAALEATLTMKFLLSTESLEPDRHATSSLTWFSSLKTLSSDLKNELV
jgi:hypothetical protein